MAGQTNRGQMEEFQGETAKLTDRPTRERVREVAAKLYGQGFERKHIAKMMLDHLVPNHYFEDGTPKPEDQRLSQARARLRSWEQDKKFRDLIWKLSVVKLDLQTPEILGGISKKAKKGRVDAAKLALEITGRYTPHGDTVPTEIHLVVEGMPRPKREVLPELGTNTVSDVVDGEIVSEEDDEV
jgi:hypothetical protein